jgi:Fe-S cluster assembly iron-binding protein IscA
MIIVTDTAINKLKEIGGIVKYSLVDGYVAGGDSSGKFSGLMGKWETLDKINLDLDCIIWKDELNNVFVIDNISLKHMDEATIDFNGGPFSPSFKVSMHDKMSYGHGESFILSTN